MRRSSAGSGSVGAARGGGATTRGARLLAAALVAAAAAGLLPLSGRSSSSVVALAPAGSRPRCCFRCRRRRTGIGGCGSRRGLQPSASASSPSSSFGGKAGGDARRGSRDDRVSTTGSSPSTRRRLRVRDAAPLLEEGRGGIAALLDATAAGLFPSEDEGAESAAARGGDAAWDLVAGTRRGALLRVRIGSVDGAVLALRRLFQEGEPRDPEGAIESGGLPVFSLVGYSPPSSSSSASSSSAGAVLLAGGADRLATAYELLREDQGVDDAEDCRGWSLRRAQGLGPHTGWVKDVAIIATEAAAVGPSTGTDSTYGTGGAGAAVSAPAITTLFSIGCNRVEEWESALDDGRREEADPDDGESPPPPPRWRHAGTRSIDSSPLGCTRSADLLCLAAAAAGAGAGRGRARLWAGGVDGRIHGWRVARAGGANREGAAADRRVDSSDEYVAWVAHQGRVNRLLMHEDRCLFSASHDGTIRCWDVSGAALGPVSSLSLDVGGGARVTALALLWDRPPAAPSAPITWLAFGTHDGAVGVTRLDRGEDGAGLSRWSVVDQIQLPGKPTVHGLCARGPLLAAGHSLGISTICWDGRR